LTNNKDKMISRALRASSVGTQP